MACKFQSLISILPLSLLAFAAWRLVNAEPQSAATESAAAGLPETAAKADLRFRTEYAPLEQGSVFLAPAGPKGLEYSPLAASLNGQKVRISGWMVKHLHADPRVFLLNARPMALIMSEYGLADDLPPSAPHVILPLRRGLAPAWTPRQLEVCGVLELGPRQEADGRISHIRLIADYVIDTESGTLPDLCAPIGLQSGRLTASARELSAAAGISQSPPEASTGQSSPQPK